MSEPSKDVLMKLRGHTACIRTGYNLFFSNFRSILCCTWIPAVLYSLAFSALGVLSVIYTPQLIYILLSASNLGELISSDSTIVTFIILTTATIIIGGLLEVLFYSCCITQLRTHNQASGFPEPGKWFHINTSAFLRVLKGVVYCLCIGLCSIIAIALIIAATTYCFQACDISQTSIHYFVIISSVIAFILFVLFMLPFSYIAMKYVMSTREGFWKNLPKNYSISMRHYGLIFPVWLINLIFLSIFGFIFALPASILSHANTIANTGNLLGDTLNMPNNIVFLTATTFFICGFAQAYIRALSIYPFYYVYGSVETFEYEKEQELNKWQNTNNN